MLSRYNICKQHHKASKQPSEIIKIEQVHYSRCTLSQRERMTFYVSWNLVNCCMTVWKMKITSEKACSRWMSYMVTQCHQIWCFLIGHISLPITVCSNNVSILHCSRDTTTAWLFMACRILWFCHRVTTLQTEKISDFIITFPDEIANNISNKCTFINTKSACYKVSVAFQQLTKVNSKC